MARDRYSHDRFFVEQASMLPKNLNTISEISTSDESETAFASGVRQPGGTGIQQAPKFERSLWSHICQTFILAFLSAALCVAMLLLLSSPSLPDPIRRILPDSVAHLVQPYCNTIAITQPDHPLFSVAGSSHHTIPFNYAMKQCGAKVLTEITFVDKHPVSPPLSIRDFSTSLLGNMGRREEDRIISAQRDESNDMDTGDAEDVGGFEGEIMGKAELEGSNMGGMGRRIMGSTQGDLLEAVSLTSPSNALNGDIKESRCWEFRGTRGQLGFALIDTLNISFVSVDYDGNNPESAPRSMLLWGVVDGARAVQLYHSSHAVVSMLRGHLPLTAPEPQPQSKIYVPLAVLEYNPNLLISQQYFPVFKETELLPFPVGVVILQVLGNWGGEFTKLCGVSVLGIPSHYTHDEL